MSFNQRINATLTMLAIRTAQTPFGGQLMLLALPLTFAVAATIITRQPVVHHWAPACGSGSGGC